MYKKILVPLDDSRFSESSLEHVKSLVVGSNLSQVVLLMVLEPVYSFSIGELAAAGNSKLATDIELHTEEVNKAKARVYINEVASKLQKQGVAIDSDIVFGSPAAEILAYAENNQFDLIVISTHGRSGISRWAFGSVAEEVIRRSTIPVLIAQPLGRKNNK